MEQSRGKSYQVGQRQDSAAPGEDTVPSPDQKAFQISTTPATHGRTQRSLGLIRLRAVWKPQLHHVIAFFLGLMEQALGESGFSGQRRGPPHPNNHIYHLRIRIPLNNLQLQQPGDETGNSRGRYRLPRICTPEPGLLIADC